MPTGPASVYVVDMYPHRIRLRGPWECTPEGGTPRRLTVPCRLGDSNLAHTPVVLTRKFGYPGRIDADEHVWLTVAEVDGSAQIALNGQVVGDARQEPFAWEITKLLQARNRLDLMVQGDVVGEVALEVRGAAYLQDVHVRRSDGKLLVQGTVAGAWEKALELYILLDRRHVFYQTIRAGQSFTALLEEAGHLIRVELINVSVVWYAVDLPVPAADRDER